jgi:hypothetical protein
MRASMEFVKRLHVSQLGRQRNPHQNVWFLIINIQAIKVAIVSSIITKIFKPCKYWTVTNQPFVKTFSNSVSFFYFLPVYCSTFVHSLFFCSIQCFVQFSDQLFSVWLFSVLFSSDTGIVFQLFWSLRPHKLNIIHQTAPSLSYSQRENYSRLRRKLPIFKVLPPLSYRW